MILADKIMNERKKNGWSQEELAERLSVSRQSVSKWEGAQSVPDLQKIIKMAELFGVTTDYLLKDDIEADEIKEHVLSEEKLDDLQPARRVSMEDANEYLRHVEKKVPHVANAVSACILSPVALMFLSVLCEEPKYEMSEAFAYGIGMIALFGLIAAAVFTFIMCGSKDKAYSYLKEERIDTEYGVIGMVTERKKKYEMRHTFLVAIGVVICILCAVPLIITSVKETSDFICISMTCVMLVLVAIGVNILVRTGSKWSSYEVLLQENEYTHTNKKANNIIGNIMSIYWCTVVAIYLAWSFITGNWGFTWIVWPVAGVGCGVISAGIKAVVGTKEN